MLSVEPASGEIGFELGWFAREPSTEQFLTRSRAIWEEGKPVFQVAARARRRLRHVRLPGGRAGPHDRPACVLRAPPAEPDERLLGGAGDRQPVRPVPAEKARRGVAARERSALPQPDAPLRTSSGDRHRAPPDEHRARPELRRGAGGARHDRQAALGRRLGEPGPGRLGGAHGAAQQPPAVPRLRVCASCPTAARATSR